MPMKTWAITLALVLGFLLASHASAEAPDAAGIWLPKEEAARVYQNLKELTALRDISRLQAQRLKLMSDVLDAMEQAQTRSLARIALLEEKIDVQAKLLVKAQNEITALEKELKVRQGSTRKAWLTGAGVGAGT